MQAFKTKDLFTCDFPQGTAHNTLYFGTVSYLSRLINSNKAISNTSKQLTPSIYRLYSPPIFPRGYALLISAALSR
jgi:hypothetical protein